MMLMEPSTCRAHDDQEHLPAGQNNEARQTTEARAQVSISPFVSPLACMCLHFTLNDSHVVCQGPANNTEAAVNNTEAHVTQSTQVLLLCTFLRCTRAAHAFCIPLPHAHTTCMCLHFTLNDFHVVCQGPAINTEAAVNNTEAHVTQSTQVLLLCTFVAPAAPMLSAFRFLMLILSLFCSGTR